MNYTIKDLPANEKPRERLIKFGASALSDSELLAILLRSGGRDNSVLTIAQNLLVEFKGFKGLLNANFNQLTKFKDIGETKAIVVMALCEISLRMFTEEISFIREITRPNDVFNYLRKDFYGLQKEHLYLLSLDSRRKVIAKDLISIGTINETLVHPREVFRQALTRNAVSIILAHNHPSNDCTPSSEDILLTERIAKCGVTLGILLLDHVIIGNDRFSSMKALNLFEFEDLNRKEVTK